MTEPLSDAAIVASVADDLPVGLWVARAPGGEFVYANRTFADIMGTGGLAGVAVGEYAAPYGIYTRDGGLYPEEQMPFVRALRARTMVTVDDIVIHRHDGGRVNIRAQARPIFDADGTLTHVVIAFIDITRQVEAETQRSESEARLFRAQRLESIGNLAGGIAHDFNNLLAAIQVIASSLRRREADSSKLESLVEIEQATAAATRLTRALLGFARRGKNLAARVSLDEVVQTGAKLFERGLGKGIDLEIDRGASGQVIGDFSQLEQVLMNLVVNARDAMPDTGRLTLRTRDLEVDAAAARRLPPLAPGPHVVLEVCDTGPGIDPSIRDRIFEPYFTTKTTGTVQGTGLGLATVFGIVESHGGAVEVASAEPHGTIMRVYLPRAAPLEGERPEPHPPRSVRQGRGTVLLVDDERFVRHATALALKGLGYQVLTAADGLEAAEIFRARHREIDAVMLDMIMPRLDGRGCYLLIREIDPTIPVLLTTGYALNEEAQRILDLGVAGFIAKPYDVEALSEALAGLIKTRRG